MSEKKNIIEIDFDNIVDNEFINWNSFRNKTFLITGATGLIGTSIIKMLDIANRKKSLDIKIIALVRSEEKARKKFTDIIDKGTIKVIIGDVETSMPDIDDPIDFIIHGASQTASKEFVEHAVETIRISVFGTINTLELARKKNVRSYIYLSSMEVYGYPSKGHKVKEYDKLSLSPLEIRNSYPIGKIASEAICNAYKNEYGVPAIICRLTQTFGPGVDYCDNRLFAYFAKCIKEKKNIVLKTKGDTERCYLYTADAVTAILTLLINGEPGKAYNAADERTYCSIKEAAQRIATEKGLKVEFDIQDVINNGFLNTVYMDLDTSALRSLGWEPLIEGGIIKMLDNTIDGF